MTLAEFKRTILAEIVHINGMVVDEKMWQIFLTELAKVRKR